MINDNDKVYVVSAENCLEATDGIGPTEVGLLKSKSGDVCDVFFIHAWKDIPIDCNKIKVFDISQTGDGYPKKICNVCHKLLDTTLFDRNQNGVNNRIIRRPSCKNCRIHMDGHDISLSDKKAWLKTKPQNEPFECPVCKKRTIAGVTSKVVLEHSHANGSVRGWVCDSCNTGLGRFKDDRALLEEAIKFIEGR